jgi:hypothetical protein
MTRATLKSGEDHVGIDKAVCGKNDFHFGILHDPAIFLGQHYSRVSKIVDISIAR